MQCDYFARSLSDPRYSLRSLLLLLRYNREVRIASPLLSFDLQTFLIHIPPIGRSAEPRR